MIILMLTCKDGHEKAVAYTEDKSTAKKWIELRPLHYCIHLPMVDQHSYIESLCENS